MTPEACLACGKQKWYHTHTATTHDFIAPPAQEGLMAWHETNDPGPANTPAQEARLTRDQEAILALTRDNDALRERLETAERGSELAWERADKAIAEAARLLKIIEDAPHHLSCNVALGHEGCDCWKKEGKP